MKKKHILILAFAAVVLSFVAACVKDLEEEGVYNTTEYIGTVVEKSTMQPIKGVNVQVTDGTHVHASAVTDALGKFLLKDINFDEVNKNYYLWLDGSAVDLPSAQETLKGLGRKTYDYKKLILYDKTDVSLLPTVITGEIDVHTATSASVSGNVTRMGNRAVTERGICFATHQTPTTEDLKKTAGSGLGSFTCELSGLTKSTTYYVRAYAKNSIGTSYGQQKTVTTPDGLPTVTINSVTNITANSAVCGGSITNDGGFAVSDKGLVWSTSQYPTLSDNHLSLGSGNSSFTGSMSNLTISTTYYVRAYAINSQGTAYSSQKTFTTKNGLPVVTTIVPTRAGTTVTSGGNVTNNGGYPVTARGICYGLTPNPDLSSSHNHTNNGSGNGSYSSTFEMPVAGVYYVRAYATNENGTSYGEQKTIDHPYYDLPTFTYGGRTYRVAPGSTSIYCQSDAVVNCRNKTLYGFTDWRLPSKDELYQMYVYANTIGGFSNEPYWSSTQHHYDGSTGSYYYYVNFSGGSISYSHASASYRYRAIRVEE